MTEKLTPEEIKKALECCTPTNESCLNCPLIDVSVPGCAGILYKATLDLINRQQSAIDVYMQENDRLKTAYIQVSEDRNETRKETEAEIEEWKKINQRLCDEMEERRKEDIGIAKGYARIEAIKEFIEKLKEKKHIAIPFDGYPVDEDDWAIYKEDIDETYKEMVGEQNAETIV